MKLILNGAKHNFFLDFIYFSYVHTIKMRCSTD